jgi:hypothetical protein
MKKLFIIFAVFISRVHAQDLDFKVSVSNDTLLLGNYLEVKFEINNGNGKFTAPDFAGWNVVSGPNSASSYSIINGEVNQRSSYTYYLEAPNEGEFIIDEAKLKTSEKEYKTPPVKIVVFGNPEGIRQHPKYKSEEKNVNPDMKIQDEPKKKRKVIKL